MQVGETILVQLERIHQEEEDEDEYEYGQVKSVGRK
jgi:hypothetical protein